VRAAPGALPAGVHAQIREIARALLGDEAGGTPENDGDAAGL
jgi:hypothetical protein